MKVRIDSQQCDLAKGFTLPDEIFTFDAKTLTTTKKSRSRTITLTLPSSPRNDAIVGFAADPCSGQRFNAESHTAEVEVDGVVLLSGEAHLLAVEAENGLASYRIRITDKGNDWAEAAATTPIWQTTLNIDFTLDEEAIIESWGDDADVRILPVCFDDYREPYSSSSLFAPQRAMTIADYHPFISVAALIRAIFRESGYEVVSQFMEKAYFRKLLLSGRYPTPKRSLAKLNASSGFLAGRIEEATATADTMGRVWLTPLMLTSSLGNFVQTTEGEGLYNNNSSLEISDEGIEYHPSVEMSVGFELFLKYTTPYRIASRERLSGIDSLYVDSGCDLHFPLMNRFTDRRNSLTAGVEYRCVVFDYDEDATMQLVCTSDEGEQTIATLTSADALVTIPTTATNPICTMQIHDGTEYVDFTGDWALYDGWVTTTGQTDVEVTLQTPPELLSPSSPKSFTRMYLHGAESGDRVTIAKECTLRPIFSSSLVMGQQVTLSDIADHDFTQAEFIEAIAQMFNLHIATDPVARKVYIEPHDDFYNGASFDWSHRADLSQPILAEEMASEHCQIRTLAYRAEGDGAVARYNAQNDAPYGEWSMEVASAVAKSGEERSVNPLFCPTISASGIHSSARSARLMQVGDRDSDEVGSVAARIVRYEGMRNLPSGQRWGFPSFGQKYPFVAFHSDEEFTLCFENRGGKMGLYRFYLNQWRGESLRRSLRVWMRVAPHELVALTDCSNEGPNIRSRYHLNLGGQGANYLLDAVERYDAQAGLALCRFRRTMED